MAFLRVETRHTQRMWSWVEAKWHEFSKYTLRHEKNKMVGEGAFSLGTSVTASLAAWGLTTVIGGVVGTAGGPLGTLIGILIGAGVGAGVGMATAVVSFTAGLVANRLQYKASRKVIYDRLTESNYDYREDFKKRFATDEEDKNGHWCIISEDGETLEKIAQRYQGQGIEFSDIWWHDRNEKIREFCRKKAPAQIPNAQVVLKKKLQVWVPVAPGPDYIVPGMSSEIYNLSYLVKHSIRDAVVHLRNAVAIHGEMVGDGGALTGGVDYIPGERETIDDVMKNVTKLHPKLKFTKADIVSHPKNGPESHWHETDNDESLDEICKATGARWFDVLEHPDNEPMRKFYLIMGRDPNDPDVRAGFKLHTLDKVYIPSRIPEEKRGSRVRVHNFNGKLHQVKNSETLYVRPGQAIWIPSARLCDRDQPFRDCDQMRSACEPAMEFTHELNKARNYTLPCLNLCRMYLDIFDEMSHYREMAQQEIEAAVLDYAKRGDHKKCYLTPAFRSLEADYRRSFAGVHWYSPISHYFNEVFGLHRRGLSYRCIRTPLKKLKKKGGTLEKYTVSGNNETFESIAQAKGITAQALAVHNVKRRVLKEDQVKVKKKDGKLEITKDALPSGTVIEIPPKNRLDKILYHWTWEKFGLGLLGPNDDARKMAATYQSRVYAQVSIAEVDIDELRKDLDAIIDEYYKTLEKNREFHQKDWDKSDPARRRLHHFTGDLLHRYDMPGLKNRIQHRLDHIWSRSTRQEKTEMTTKAVLKILVFAPVFGAIGGGKKAVFKAIDIPSGTTALTAMAVNPIMSSLAMPTMDTNLDGSAILIREGVDKGWSVTSAVTKALTNETVVPKLVNKAYDGNRNERLTGTHALDFRRERIALSALGQKKDLLKNEERALKEAAKVVDDLFVKISRHYMNAWDRWFNKVFPRVDKLMNNHDKIGYGLTGCRDSYQHLKHLFEFRHSLDKAERYLLGALSLALRLREWEGYLAGIEKEVRENVDKAAGKWIAEGDHERCHRKKIIGHRHCYGPSKDDPSLPAKPIRAREEQEA